MVACIGLDAPVYLLALLSKRERANFTLAEVAAMRAFVMEIKRHRRGRAGR